MSESACYRVLKMPDIVTLLVDLISKKDLVNLARTSRNCFGSTIGFVWREVRGVHNLFKLIPGTKCSAVGAGDTWKLAIPDLNAADLSRFKFYAPYVSHLHILPNLHAKYRFSDWEKLMRYAKSTTLLPNLQTLVYARDSSKDEKFVRWIIPFLCANILTVHTHSVEWSCEANISMGRASKLLKAISKRCADITDLSFFPVEPYFHTDDDETGLEIDSDSDPAGNVVPGGAIQGNTSGDAADPNDELGSGQLGSGPPPFWEYFKHTRSLQNLTTTSFIIHSEILAILATLPNLRKIVLYCAYPNEYIVYQLSPEYPEHPFPSLDTLHLVLPDMECVSQIWEVGPLVNRLTDVSVVLRAGSEDAWGMDDDDDDEFAYTRSFIAFIPELCKRSPRIQKFTVDFDATEGEMIQAVSLETLKSLVTLPLQKLDLRHASLGSVAQACNVLKGCHTLRDLHIQDQRVSYDELLRFAQIPGLECLHAEIHWKDAKGLRRCLNNPPQRSSDIRLVLCSLPLHLENDNAMLKDVTSFLCSCFPKLQQVSLVGTSMYGYRAGPLDPTCARLNEMVKNRLKASNISTRRRL
ncbi:hypothetical protein FS749_011355 [Ceratobasidium sp. UAMH 11750]|nr:hypothetical protein FS749_011355 [Ceratobasidium sp. UAMH 11750]